MDKIAKILNLNPEASKEAVEAAVQAVINRAETAENELKVSGAKLVDMTAERDVLKNEAQAKKDEQIVNYVESLIKADPTKLPQKEALLNMAKADFKTFKTLSPVASKDDESHIIDKNIEQEENVVEGKEAEIATAKNFYNMGHAEKISLKNSNYAEYLKQSELYEKHYSAIAG